ncbi:predicted protein [Naegleria gruberi]|uniref:Predicted protein n=1 Tax=Naegleria gruberi TaxID=5762 RepID=D2VSS8_NAEGR|nr:uncharacterized protein NAEGRDRAFT_51974 [Naegleria gruberi]EFC40170.1 predicted protein [Naegleria gruberi]|eukprot:XP_002672914.1 predicted protein [Naegleria gruberi strain NEG-M]
MMSNNNSICNGCSSTTTTTINNNSRFLSPTASSAARRRETLLSTPKKAPLNSAPSSSSVTHPSCNVAMDEKQSSSKKNHLIHTPPPNHHHHQHSIIKHTNSVPSKRGTLLYDPKNAPSTVSKSSSKTTHQLKPQPLPPTFASPPKRNTTVNFHSPRSKAPILRTPKSPPNNYIPENQREAWSNLQTLGVMSPYSKSLFSPSCPETPFYKKQGRFGNIILQTSLSKMTKGIMLDNEEYLTVGCYTQCNIRVNHKCLLKFDPDYDEEGYPCIFLCVYEGASLIKLNGEILEGLIEDDMDGILLKHDDEVRIIDKLFYYENLNQYEREKMKLVREVVSQLPLFDAEKENQPNRINSTPKKENVDAKTELFSPPPTGFPTYVDTPKRKQSITTKRTSNVSAYGFQMNATSLGSFSVATDSSLIYDCNNENMTSTGRKSVSFGESEVVVYKPSHEPRRVSARLQIDDDLSTSMNDDSTISFGCDNSMHVDDVTITQSNLTSLSNLCQIICLQEDQQCTVQPVIDTGKPPVLDCDDIDLLIDDTFSQPNVETNNVEPVSSMAMDESPELSPNKEPIIDEDSVDAIPTPSSSHSSKASNSSCKKRTPHVYTSSDSESDMSSCKKSVLSEEDERFLNERFD